MRHKYFPRPTLKALNVEQENEAMLVALVKLAGTSQSISLAIPNTKGN